MHLNIDPNLNDPDPHLWFKELLIHSGYKGEWVIEYANFVEWNASTWKMCMC